MYHILYFFLFLVLAPILKIKALKNKYSFSFKERLTLYKDNLENSIWLHCASVGELNTAKPIYKFLKKLDFNIVITVSSPRGKSYAKNLYPNAIIREVPFDFVFSVRRFLRIYNPKALIIMEEELWYNLVKIPSLEIPVILLNGRISQKSFKFYWFFKHFYRRILQNFKVIVCRSLEDEEKFKMLCPKCNTLVCGDLKFISSLEKKPLEIKIPQKKVFVAGSTYKKEEEILLNALKRLNDYLLILAPRHIERLKEVEDLVKSLGFKYEKFSKTKNLTEDIDVYIIDVIGVLPSLYKYADVAFIGGTIEDIGGHNPLEALVEGVPIIVGKNTYKINHILKEFEDIVFVANSSKEIINVAQNLREFKSSLSFSEKIKNIKNCYEEVLKRYLT